MKAITIDIIREFEREFSYPPFLGVPIGPTLNDTLIINFLHAQGRWDFKNQGLNYLRIARYLCFTKRIKSSLKPFPEGKIIIALLDATPRLSELVLPVLEELNNEDCVLLCGNDSVLPLITNNVYRIVWDQVLTYIVNNWWVEFRRCKSEWVSRLKSISRTYQLPRGASDELAFSLMISCRQVSGCIEFLKKAKPAIIVTDYDRNAKWSCLVLAAKSLGIPTVTLVHGVISKNAQGYSPVLADKIVCWGEFDRIKLIAAGEHEDKIFIGGCPRLSRDLPSSAKKGMKNILLDPQKPVVMFASSPERQRLSLTELFCTAVEKLDFLSGMVRLHPSEKLITYKAIIDRYPSIIFFESKEASLDDSLALANVVVCKSSGMGSDALVKGLNVVVLDPERELLGHGGDLVKLAGCPHARTAEELSDILYKIIFDNIFCQQLAITRESYVEHFCCAYGKDSARLTADIIRRQLVSCPA